MSSGVGIIEAPQQDLANLDPENVLEQTIDVERFEAVPEHDGNLQRLIERYGDNPGSCPYIKSMGEAGIQLVQKLAEAEKDPERGPTIRELMEAKKREAQSQSTVIENSNSAKSIETAATTRTDINVEDKRPTKTIESDAIVEHVLTHEHVAGIISEAVGEVTKPNGESDVETEEPRVKAIEIGLPHLVIAETEAEDVLQQQALDVEARRIGEFKELYDQASPVVDTKVSKEPEVERPVRIEDTAHLEKRIEPARDLAAKALEAEITDDTTNYAAIDEEARDTTTSASESVIVEDRPLDINETTAALGIEYPEPGTNDIREETGLMAVIDTDYAVAKGVELDAEAFPDEVRLDLAPDTDDSFRKSGVELAETTVEAAKTIDLQTELNGYIETLEPSKAEAAETALKSLAEVLESHERKGNPAESSASEVKEIEHIFVELLEALNLDYEDETVKKLIQALFTPELLAAIAEDYELSIDQLNYLGTREYKPASITSLFSQLLQLIKRRTQPYLQLGKYALAVAIEASLNPLLLNQVAS